MRLLEVSKFLEACSSLETSKNPRALKIKLRECQPGQIPYAILSHTWGKNEILLKDLEKGTAHQKPEAWAKIKGSCEEAAKDNLQYIWIDTCCIDKRSSAELTEAINSMFAWYKQAHICYAYLSDVPASRDSRQAWTSFASSRWFTRGWTLQELVASRDVRFFYNNWTRCGEGRKSMSALLSQITGIPAAILGNPGLMRSASIAQRMSWASRRNTTQPEDMAYCLLGIFDVTMDARYGEKGEKAFIRLQEEIIKVSDDMSIFAWVKKDASRSPSPLHGLFATSIKDFADSRDIFNSLIPSRSSYSIVNKALRIETPLLRTENNGIYLAPIYSQTVSHGTSYDPHERSEPILGILLKADDPSHERFGRVHVDRLPNTPMTPSDQRRLEKRTIYILRAGTYPDRNY